MATNEEVAITLVVSTRLGIYGAALASMEPAIDEAIRIISMQREETPDNTSIPIMMSLMVAAKDLIKSHKVIERFGELMSTGGMVSDQSETVQ